MQQTVPVELQRRAQAATLQIKVEPCTDAKAAEVLLRLLLTVPPSGQVCCQTRREMVKVKFC